MTSKIIIHHKLSIFLILFNIKYNIIYEKSSNYQPKG
jgi:hypothetical protein